MGETWRHWTRKEIGESRVVFFGGGLVESFEINGLLREAFLLKGFCYVENHVFEATDVYFCGVGTDVQSFQQRCYTACFASLLFPFGRFRAREGYVVCEVWMFCGEGFEDVFIENVFDVADAEN